MRDKCGDMGGVGQILDRIRLELREGLEQRYGSGRADLRKD